MIKIKNLFKSYSIRTQMILGFAMLTIITATTVGLTALRINYRYLENEKRTQSVQTIRDSYKALEREIANMVILTASRPTLAGYIMNKDYGAILYYLQELKQGMVAIDAITICDSQDRVVASNEDEPAINFCNIESNPFYTVVYLDGAPHAWLVLGRRIYNNNEVIGKVLLGINLDYDLVTTMCDQCNLYQTLIYNGEPIASSLGEHYAEKTDVRSIPIQLADENFRQSFKIHDRLYYVSDFTLAGSGIVVEVALDVTSIRNDQRQQEMLLTIVIGCVVIIAVLFGAYLAQRIQKPLGQLVASTDRLQTDNLETPVRVDSNVSEVIELTQALESSRVSIKSALNLLQKEKQWTDLLLESIVEGIMILNDKGVITYFSPGAERISGWKCEEAIGHSVDSILKPADRSAPFRSQIPPLGEKHRFSTILKGKKKSILSITHAELPSDVAGDARMVLVFRDVSEEEALSHLLGNFLANITHEFRTPLSALAASIEILLNEADDLEPWQIKELLKSIHLSTLNLENLIDNLLEGASIETGRFSVSPRPGGLRNVILSASEIIEPLLKKYGQHLTIDLPDELPLVKIDSRRISQVLINLLNNASKYGPTDEDIKLSAHVLPDRIEVAVRDHGPGIPMKYRKELFSGFILTQIEDGSIKKGAGLGLSVTNAIVKAHGGRVGVRDIEGGGAEFWFTIPIAGDS